MAATHEMTIKAGKARGIQWSNEETLALLDVWGDDNIQAQMDGTTRDAKVYVLLANTLHQLGYERNATQVKYKVKNSRRIISGHPTGVTEQYEPDFELEGLDSENEDTFLSAAFEIPPSLSAPSLANTTSVGLPAITSTPKAKRAVILPAIPSTSAATPEDIEPVDNNKRKYNGEKVVVKQKKKSHDAGSMIQTAIDGFTSMQQESKRRFLESEDHRHAEEMRMIREEREERVQRTRDDTYRKEQERERDRQHQLQMM
ncbi:hypothetical protein LOTGIDRAFT_171404 [Lottia gigantea]|uniref:Myb/SANT-like DNA-binding domain-containing protein n=1 Tax=Lottia gigantea TaxID=225164 RepID=V4BBN9_LOTGI|nr:hypothetical protein LOTGIDRAFT_171404 [Lottia gigantea]ESP03467.1 hypothetical protein LOTGIDRAFT_171404 [Lottia gigantea]